MTNHDSFADLSKSKQLLDSLSDSKSVSVIDLDELREFSSDPFFLSSLMVKLIEERKRTNELLESINDKYDKIMFELKTKDLSKDSVFSNKNEFSVLSDADEKIVSFIEAQGKASASDVRIVMGYKGVNAASQRLNKLFKEGYLRKVQAGKKVLYLPKA